MFTPFAFVKSAAAAAPLNPIAVSWAATASISNTSVISAVSTFVNTLQTASIWSKMVAVYPMISDSNTSATAKTQFTYNLVNPATYTATYLNGNGTGAKGGWTNASGDTFIMQVTPTNIQPGQTINLRVTQADPTGAGQIAFPSSVKQVSGSQYVPTLTAGDVDIVTFISFDASSLYLSNVKNFVASV